MAIDPNNGFDELRAHVGHDIECVLYREWQTDYPPVNVALECLTCGCVLVDFDRPVTLGPERAPA